MRQITVKYQGECRKCGATLIVGQPAIYERHIGIFCPTCQPTDAEEIRHYRQEAGDRRADKYDEWASKREAKATAQLNTYPEIRHDWAFITQPGHIPLRSRMIKSDDRAYESLNVAEGMRAKADSLRHVRVKGDADRLRQQKRDYIKNLLRIGMKVETYIYGQGIVKKINKTTATIANCGTSGTFTTNVDLSFLKPLETPVPDTVDSVALNSLKGAE